MSQTDFSTVSIGPIPFVTPPPAESTTSLFMRPFTVDEYHRLAEVGVIGTHERLELLEGIITMMSPIGARHSTTVELIYRLLLKSLPTGWDVSMQRDILLANSVPQPDLCILRGHLRDYSEQKPMAEHIGLIIEVAETTLAEDRGVKQKLYAAAGVPEYWIVNIADKKLEVHRRPVAAAGEQPSRYESIESFGSDETVAVTLDGAQIGTIAVRDILP